MTTPTSSSDRYAEAREALAGLERAYPLGLGRGQLEQRVIDALRALITPPATEETPADIAQRLMLSVAAATLPAIVEQAVRAGIQAAWESWEPEVVPSLAEEARYDRIEWAIRLAFEGEGEAWSDKLSGDRLARVARDAIEGAGL